MDISLRLRNLSNEEFKFLRQIDVERVDVHNPLLVPGYEELGEVYFRNVSKVIEKIRDSGNPCLSLALALRGQARNSNAANNPTLTPKFTETTETRSKLKLKARKQYPKIHEKT